MEKLESFGLSVVSAALIVAIITGLFRGKDASAVVVKMIAGLFLAFTVVRPLVALDLSGLDHYLEHFSQEGSDAAQAGEELARDTYNSYIKAETQAYILDKARDYGATLEVDIKLDDNGVPWGAELTGNVSPYAKAALSGAMETELGILKENQQWIG